MSLDYERLSQLPALAGFTSAEIDAFFAASQRLGAKEGDRIIRAGDPADCFFILARGALTVVVETYGKPMPVARLGPGQLVGEMPLIYHQPVRQADVVATEDCHLFRWTYADYETLGQRDPALIKKFRSNLGKIAASRSWTSGLASAGAPGPPAPPPQPPPPAPAPAAPGPPRPAPKAPTTSALPLRAIGEAGSQSHAESTHAVLKRATPFMGFTEDELRQIEAIATPLPVVAEQALCHAGDPADSFFVVAAGQVEVRIDKNGSAFALARLGSGQVFGEMALVYKQPQRSATVVAIEPGKVLRIGFDDYNRLIAGLPEIGRKLKNNLSRVAASRTWSLPGADEARQLRQNTDKP